MISDPRLGKYNAPPPMTIDSDHNFVAKLTTELGVITVELLPKSAPEAVNNFVFLARDGFYDDLTFHKTVEGQYTQTGDPRGDGRGNPGYRFADEFDPALDFEQAGAVAMANRGPNTNGCQFLVTRGAMPHLKGRNPIFGRVIDGLDVVNNIPSRDPEWDWPEPEPGPKLLSVEILESG